jgi:hypothetical protein
MEPLPDTVEEALRRFGAGESGALDRLLPLVYDELRQLAAAHLRRHAGHATLQPTALVHEVLLRLLGKEAAGSGPQVFENARHWYATAARLMPVPARSSATSGVGVPKECR